MPVAVFLIEICVPAMTPPEESVVMPDRVAPVTCASIETAMDKVRRTASKLAEIFVSLRGPIAHLLNDHAVIVSRNFLLAFRGFTDVGALNIFTERVSSAFWR